MRIRQFSTRSLFRTVAIWAVLLAIVSGVVRWQLQSIRYQQAGRVLYMHGGTYTNEYPHDTHRLNEEAFNRKWKGPPVRFYQRNPKTMVDLSVNAWPRKEREAEGSVVVPPWDDEAVAELTPFKHLREINLRGAAAVTDQGLQRLTVFRKLERIDVSGSGITQEGLALFRKSKPRCEIINDADWMGKMSPLDYSYWQRLELGIIDEDGNFLGEP